MRLAAGREREETPFARFMRPGLAARSVSTDLLTKGGLEAVISFEPQLNQVSSASQRRRRVNCIENP
jgi:hypothetical protein